MTSYRYDVQDHQGQVTDAEGSLSDYFYSDRDLLTQEASPVSGVTTHRSCVKNNGEWPFRKCPLP